MKKIEEIRLEYLRLEAYSTMKQTMEEAYTLEDTTWSEKQIARLIELFPQGQVMITINGQLAGVALSIVVDYEKYCNAHTYDEITGNYSFDTHDPDGDALYGIEVFIHPMFRGLRLGRRLYDYRKELCEQLNLKAILFGGRLPKYHKYVDQMKPHVYIEKVRNKEIHDPVLNFQLANDFHVKKILKNYLIGDEESCDYAALLQWNNIYYEKPQHSPQAIKTEIRLGLIQWQMRPHKSVEEVLRQLDFFVESVANMRCDFAVLPELIHAPLMHEYNDLREIEAIRALTKYNDTLKKAFNELAIRYNINLVCGSMHEWEDNILRNKGYIFERNGSIHQYHKMFINAEDEKQYGLQGGETLNSFSIEGWKVAVLLGDDITQSTLSTHLAEQGMDLLLVPFLTNTQSAYTRIRYCAQARAIEQECYVAIVGSVGNIPHAKNMDIQYAQSAIFTPCAIAFPANGIKAETGINTEMIVVSELDLITLKELRTFGKSQYLKRKNTISL